MTVPPESALWMEGVDSKDGSKDGAISVPEPSLSPSVEPIFVVSIASRLRSTIARRHRLYASFACLAIWGGTFHAMGVI
jgi:hypothetical protein